MGEEHFRWRFSLSLSHPGKDVYYNKQIRLGGALHRIRSILLDWLGWQLILELVYWICGRGVIVVYTT